MKLFAFVLSLFVATAMYGQVDFSGTWKLDTLKSQFNNVNSSSAPINLVVEQKDGTITYQRNDHPKESLKIGSADSLQINDANSTTKVSINFTADKSGLIETRIYSYPEYQTAEVAAKKTRTWSLSADKQTLAIQDHIESTAGKSYDMMLIYERQ